MLEILLYLNLIFIEKAIKIQYLKTLHTSILIISLLFCITISAQTAIIQGVILNEKNEPVEGVNVKFSDGATTTNTNGYYRLDVPANQKITIIFTHINLKQARQVIELSPNENFEFNIVLKANEEQLSEIVINSRTRKRMEGIVTIDPAVIRKIPGANAGVENILKSFAGVNSNNELSTQYAVRGGNYDENLVYVNEIEIYRPFLIRSGQQEGLSFTNTDLVQNVDFSAGGFQAKYGDKLSSVLDITYRIPKTFGAVAEASFLGGSIAVDAVSKNVKWTSITGVRYRDNSLFVNSQDVETNFRPIFADIQTYTTFTPSAKWQWSFLGNISQNSYNYEPTSRQTNFGTIDNPIALVVDYEGQEKDKYTTYFGALKADFKVSDALMLKFIGSAYHTQEQEYFDIVSDYNFGKLDTNIGSENFGEVEYVTKIGTAIDHARNNLDALIVNAEVKGVHTLAANTIEWGFKYTRENIRDRIVEWQVIDSAGFSIDPPLIDLPDYQPEIPNVGPLAPFQYVRATNFVTINRWSGYAQWRRKDNIGSHEITYNLGVRAHQWKVNPENQEGKSQMTFSPRAEVAIKPDWDKDMVFRFSTGLYHQPPFYRELRDASGAVRTNVKAQQSIHFVLSNDYSFKMWERPFKLVSELYYKSLSDVNTYTIDNVRIRYAANNEAKAYAQGLDIRMNGEFVPGTESWLSFGYMKTEENSNNRGYIARPTDQLLKFGILFQDFMPRIPSIKLYLNLVYNTGLPGGSPAYADPYVFQSRLRDYRRADVGFSYILTENNFKRPDTHWLKKFKDLSVGFEIFNIFNNQNAITNTWVRDIYSKLQYGIPNYLTTRVFNVKVSTKF